MNTGYKGDLKHHKRPNIRDGVVVEEDEGMIANEFTSDEELGNDGEYFPVFDLNLHICFR